MSCFHPLIARRRSRSERIAAIIDRISPNSLIFSHGEHELYPYYLDRTSGEFCEWFSVPCGRCIGCRLAYSREWANRNVLESLNYNESDNFFLTLTYDQDHVPLNDQGLLTTRLDDVSAFMKRLRRYYDYTYNHQNIRFFASSEYGSETLRPHYHASLFNCPIPDLKKLCVNFRGDVLYTSPLLEKLWGHGFVVVGEFAWNTAAYTARYIVKKLKGDAALEYNFFGLEPESTRMSRKPGIGMDYLNQFEDWMEIYQKDEIVLPSNSQKANVIKPPKIYDKKLQEVDPLLYAKIKSKRAQAAEISLKAKLDQSGYTKAEYFSIVECAQSTSAKQLKRNFADLT